MGFVHYLWRPPTRLKLLAGVKPPWIANSTRGKYLAQIVLSTPPWLSREQRAEIMALHEEARRITRETGILHVLDHIEPINHEDICGLTVPWNLRIRTWRHNAAKGNSRPNPDQRDLFETPLLAIAQTIDREHTTLSASTELHPHVAIPG